MKQPSIIRTAHGSAAGVLLVAETPPLDEVPAPSTLTVTSKGRPFARGNTAAKNKRPALCLLGDASSDDPRLRSARRKADAYRRRRCSELAAQHGGYLSAGASGMIAASARDLANSQIVQALGDEAFARGEHDAAAKYWAQSSRLSDQSRTKELTAIALAAREAEARREIQHWTPPRPAVPARTTPDPEMLAEARRIGIIK